MFTKFIHTICTIHAGHFGLILSKYSGPSGRLLIEDVILVLHRVANILLAGQWEGYKGGGGARSRFMRGKTAI